MRDLLLVGVVLVGGCGHVVGVVADDAAVDDGLRDGTETGDAAPATSCVLLAPTCGPNRTSNCCESPLVTGGTFARSFDVSGDGMYSDSSFPATVSDFRLDKYEVTVGRFRQFVNANQGTRANPPLAGAGAHPNLPGSGWDASTNTFLTADAAQLVAALNCQAMFQTWTDAPGNNESRPIVCETWYEAAAFCAWDNGYLPTETEWNYAAAGGNQQRAFPWSNPPASLSIDDTRASWDCTGDGVLGCTANDLVGVGLDPAGDSRFGQSDLAGNAWEWTLDWKKSPYTNPCVDCAELDPSPQVHVVRGGSWGDAAFNMRGADRGTVRPPAVRESAVGFRCARQP